MTKDKKERKTKVAKYVTDADKKNHFVQNTNKCVEIINRQLVKIGKQAKGRTFIYSPEQVEKIDAYLLEQIGKTKQRLLRSVENIQDFNVGV